jgi:hypothetical protein
MLTRIVALCLSVIATSGAFAQPIDMGSSQAFDTFTMNDSANHTATYAASERKRRAAEYMGTQQFPLNNDILEANDMLNGMFLAGYYTRNKGMLNGMYLSARAVRSHGKFDDLRINALANSKFDSMRINAFTIQGSNPKYSNNRNV